MLPIRFAEGTLVVADPMTGEVFTVADAPPAVLARATAAIDDLKAEAGRARNALGDELQARMGKERRLDVGTHMVQRDQRREWDTDATWAALSRLHDLGLITGSQVDDAMPEKTARRPDGRQLNALLTDLLTDVGDDPTHMESVQQLARARVTRTYVKVQQAATDSTGVEV